MLHMRVICPSERTEEVLGALEAEPGATHIVVFRGAAVEPRGDMVQADVARECANEVLRALKALDVVEEGGVTMVPVETVLSAAARKAEHDAPGDAADSIVWEELLSHTREESTLNRVFVAFLTIACLLAAIGVVTDSPITIVGAMVVGPEFGPLAALAVALVRRDRKLRRRSILALVVAFPIAMGVTLLATFVVKMFGWMDVESLETLHQVDFVYKVGPISFVVALLAGAAGMLALLSEKSAALVGVFISVTTVPAAGFAVVAAANGEWRIAGLSSLQLAVNMLGIVVACALVLWVRTRADQEFAAALKGISSLIDD
ncbi:DUF389 domain-containing protein [Rhodococcus sp. OK302]|uniref:DUF389 domain-containing protein n=1 Tax=Rhodococcus sp. OK302 TaxID=1882769 RepID=UPI000B941AC9|nr:DUF389 domain-containing protein [Rhodococcus sp. OK302]OYD69919.1 putative hydrophobic protein (TIGR00271 family) [Rhodococcus sp. OK302]